MLPLPWWILGTVPSEEESDVEEVDCNETVSDGDKSIPTLEIQESLPSTPISLFRTPSASPYNGNTDNLSGVVNYSSFLQGAKRRSSVVLEGDSPKIKKTRSRKSAGRENRKFERNETEVMIKTDNGTLVTDHDTHADDTFYILETDSSRPNSPPLLNKSTESLADKEILNQSIRGEDPESERREEAACSESHPREYPMFFTSFNDTTVLFNSTFAGDLDVDRDQKNAAVGDWVFKGNKFLEENKVSSSKSPVFKEPTRKPKKSLESSERLKDSPTGSDISKSSTRARVAKKEEKTTTPARHVVPTMEKRRTPSRKAKTYKSMKVI